MLYKIRKSFGCFFRLDNLVIIDTNDAVLVAKKEETKNLKDVIKNFDPIKFEGSIHKMVYRPWGHYISIENDSRWQVKKIEVNPGQTLSLQMHHHREHWIFVKGTAKVEINGETKLFERIVLLSL